MKKKPFECDVCGSRSTQNAHLKGHIEAVHEDTKPFKCDFCDFAFNFNSCLNKHKKQVHEGKKPFKCTIYDSSFAQNLDEEKKTSIVTSALGSVQLPQI